MKIHRFWSPKKCQDFNVFNSIELTSQSMFEISDLNLGYVILVAIYVWVAVNLCDVLLLFLFKQGDTFSIISLKDLGQKTGFHHTCIFGVFATPIKIFLCWPVIAHVALICNKFWFFNFGKRS